MLTTGVFLAVFFGTLGLLLAILIPLYMIPLRQDVREIRDGLKPVTELEKVVRRWLEQRGLDSLFKSRADPQEPDPLSPEKVRRRDELINKGKIYGLSPEETSELKKLLEEDARDDFISGVINFLAFIGLLVIIDKLVSELTRQN